jgi:hypothetical protein
MVNYRYFKYNKKNIDDYIKKIFKKCNPWLFLIISTKKILIEGVLSICLLNIIFCTSFFKY